MNHELEFVVEHRWQDSGWEPAWFGPFPTYGDAVEEIHTQFYKLPGVGTPMFRVTKNGKVLAVWSSTGKRVS